MAEYRANPEKFLIEETHKQTAANTDTLYKRNLVKAYLWSAKSSITNEIVVSSEKPTIEQMFWADFAYNENVFSRYTLEYDKLSEWEVKSWLSQNPNVLKFRVIWTAYGDCLLHIFVATESEAKEIVAEIQKASTWNEMQLFLAFYDFKYF